MKVILNYFTVQKMKKKLQRLSEVNPLTLTNFQGSMGKNQNLRQKIEFKFHRKKIKIQSERPNLYFTKPFFKARC